MPEYGLPGIGLYLETHPGRMSYCPHHPHRVSQKSLPWVVAYGPDNPLPQVYHASYIVNYTKICDVIKKSIDSEISAEGILVRKTKDMGILYILP